MDLLVCLSKNVNKKHLWENISTFSSERLSVPRDFQFSVSVVRLSKHHLMKMISVFANVTSSFETFESSFMTLVCSLRRYN